MIYTVCKYLENYYRTYHCLLFLTGLWSLVLTSMSSSRPSNRRSTIRDSCFQNSLKSIVSAQHYSNCQRTLMRSAGHCHCFYRCYAALNANDKCYTHVLLQTDIAHYKITEPMHRCWSRWARRMSS